MIVLHVHLFIDWSVYLFIYYLFTYLLTHLFILLIIHDSANITNFSRHFWGLSQ
jgi:hypothetical protein